MAKQTFLFAAKSDTDIHLISKTRGRAQFFHLHTMTAVHEKNLPPAGHRINSPLKQSICSKRTGGTASTWRLSFR
jgi:hypothetical protein